MGRQDDLERMRQSHYDQSYLDEVDDLDDLDEPHPIPRNARRAVPVSQNARRNVPVRPQRRNFSLWMMMLVGFGLAIILARGVPSLSLPSGDVPFWRPRAIFASAGQIDKTVPQPGDRILDKFVVTQGWNHDHMGVDVALPNGQDSTGIPLYAIGYQDKDVQVFCWTEALTGLNVSTYAEGMDYAFDYGHLSECKTNPGDPPVTVKAGQPIAKVGNSGAATTGPHLHFQQRQNGTVNPVTGTHIPGWKTYIELSLSGETLGPDGRVEEAVPPESDLQLVPYPDTSQPEPRPTAPQPDGTQDPYPSNPLTPDMTPPASGVNPVPTPSSPSTGTWRSPVYPPI